MENKIISALGDIGYSGNLSVKEDLLKAVELGAKSLDYTNLVSFICNELKVICNLDEQVNSVNNPEDSIAFLMELSSFLKELGCPYSTLTEGHISDRLNTTQEKLLLLDYLLTKLMGARILREKKPEKKIELKLQESPQAADLRKMLMTLKFSKPPPNITVQQLFQKLIPTVQVVVQKAGKDLLGNPIFNGYLSEQQWATLEKVHRDLNKEYAIRREVMLTRLDCTIQSFEWSDKTKGKDALIEEIYADKRKTLKVDPEVDLSDLLSARDDLAIIEKTSNANVRKNTKSEINKVIIGQVPDRGGRTSEQAPPPPEMPSWQQRQPGPAGGGRGGGYGQRGGGRGDWNGSRGGRRGGYQQQNNYGGSGGQQEYQNRVGNVTNTPGTSNWRENKNFGSNLKNFDTSLSGYATGVKSRLGPRGASYDSVTNNTYGGRSCSSEDTNGPKRLKTYDSFQTNKTTYADQYVQDNQHNQQFRPQSDRGGYRGKSNYKRGGYQSHW